MKNQLKLQGRLFLLAVMGAVALRPVAVSANNSFFVSRTILSEKICCEFSSAHPSKTHESFSYVKPSSVLKSIAKESPNEVSLVPRFSKEKAPAGLVSRLNVASAVPDLSPQSFLVLRI